MNKPTVALIEDSDTQRHLLSGVLSSRFEVVEFSSYDAYVQSPQRFDATIADMVTSDASHIVIIGILKQPRSKLILISSYIQDSRIPSGVTFMDKSDICSSETGATDFVRKVERIING